MTDTQSPQARLFSSLASAPTSLSADTVRERIDAAETAAHEAEIAWRTAALAAEASGDNTDELSAEAAMLKARREVARLEAVLVEVAARDANEALAAQRAREAEEDAEASAALDVLCKAAKAAEPAIKSYANAYAGLASAYEQFRHAAARNPRVRPDLVAQSLPKRVGDEIVRHSEGRPLAPGGDTWTAASTDPRNLTPIKVYFDDLARAIREGLSHVEA